MTVPKRFTQFNGGSWVSCVCVCFYLLSLWWYFAVFVWCDGKYLYIYIIAPHSHCFCVYVLFQYEQKWISFSNFFFRYFVFNKFIHFFYYQNCDAHGCVSAFQCLSIIFHRLFVGRFVCMVHWGEIRLHMIVSCKIRLRCRIFRLIFFSTPSNDCMCIHVSVVFHCINSSTWHFQVNNIAQNTHIYAVLVLMAHFNSWWFCLNQYSLQMNWNTFNEKHIQINDQIQHR